MHKLLSVGVAAALLTGMAATAEQRQEKVARWGQVWGTWVWQTHVSSTTANPSLITLHIDGIVSLTPGDMFGSPAAATRTYRTPAHGVWVRTGWQSVGGTSVWLISDAATGALVGWGRARTKLEFTDDFDHFQGKMFVETLPCVAGPPVSCPDPLDAQAQWVPNRNMPADGFSISATRLEHVTAGPLP